MNLLRCDRLLTGVALTVVGLVGAGSLYALGLEIDLTPEPFRGWKYSLVIQGNVVEFERGQDSVTCPVVRRDGTLDPAFRYDYPKSNWPVEIERTESEFALFERSGLLRRAFESVIREDYRTRWQHLPLTRERDSYWLVWPSLGLLRVSGDGRLEGSLADEGWVAGRRAPSSFNRALGWHPQTGHWSRSMQVFEHQTQV